jgi:hypothetical protein
LARTEPLAAATGDGNDESPGKKDFPELVPRERLSFREPLYSFTTQLFAV